MPEYTLGPLPWNEEELKALYFRSFGEAERAIQEHPGFGVSNNLTSVNLSFAIFTETVGDLLKGIDNFHEQAADSRFWTRPHRQRFEKCVLTVTKGLFAAAAGALSLVNHSRVIKNRYSIMGYDEKREEIFDQAEHDFIHGLRNYVTHSRIVEADWQREYSSEGKRTRFLIQQSALLRWEEWTEAANRFIQLNSNGVDVERVFRNYAVRVEAFHEWFRGQIECQFKDELNGYRYYERLLRRFEASSFWTILLTNLIARSVDPFGYLDRYLTEREMVEVLALQPRSVQQVDRIIEMLDEYGACTSELRELAYKAFGVAR